MGKEEWDVVVGAGEVGKSLGGVLEDRRKVLYHDPPKNIICQFKKAAFMHVCIPFSSIETVMGYIDQFEPTFVVIHSTVPVGTTRKLHEAMLANIKKTGNWTFIAYSPVRGLHPNLGRHIQMFPKWYATFVDGHVDESIQAYFARAGIQTRKAPDVETLEWMKLWETTSYSVSLVMWQEIERESRSFRNRIESMNALKTYLFEKRRVYDGDKGTVPIYDIVPGPIGGHCISPNWDLLKPLMSKEMYEWLVTTNAARRKD
mgnify:CR=1 FL=1